MIRLHRAALAFAGVLGLAAACPNAARAAAPTTVTLENGLRVVLAPDSLATAVDVAVWYATGTRAEREGQHGLTRLVERLMFLGSKGTPEGEHARRLSAEGGTVNTRTTADYSSFWETVPSEAVPTALRLEADRMAGLVTAPASFARARDDAKARLGTPTPVSAALSLLSGLVFAGEPYGRPLGGAEPDLASVGPRDVEAWWKAHYGPSTATLTVVGRFDPEGTLAIIRSAFGPLRKTTAALAPPARPTKPEGDRRGHLTLDSPARIVAMGWRTGGATDPGRPALELLAQLLGGDQGSRFTTALVSEQSVAFASQAGFDERRDASLFWAFAAAREDADSATVEQHLLAEIDRLGHEPPTGDELDRARDRLLTAKLFGMQTVRDRAVAIGEGVLLAGDARDAENRLEGIAKLTPADVQRAAMALSAGPHAVVWVGPASTGGAR